MTAESETATPTNADALRPILEHWGVIAYDQAWARQKEIQQKVIRGEHPGCVVLCEHPPTITAGTSTKAESFKVSREALAARNVAFYEVERGGDLTFHGPGQLVCYPLLNLNYLRKDVHWYMRALESAIIATVAEYGINAEKIAGRTGVWIVSAEDDKLPSPVRRKIASIGVRLSRWCSMHGLSLNVTMPLETLKTASDLIVPCGLTDISVTSMTEELKSNQTKNLNHRDISVDAVGLVLAEKLSAELGFSYGLRN